MIEVRGAVKDLGQFSLRGLDLRVEQGEYFVVLGPTGAGKTVLLECIAGLWRLDQGEVWLEGRNVTDLDPELRNVGYVPQDYVLFPHMSLQDNIEFSLSIKRVPAPERARRAEELAEMLGIRHLLHRRPRTLSGGEAQRGAMARALAPEPTLLLLDEPLSALDENTRGELSVELDRIAHRFGTTVIHVCHNFDEALELGDKIAIMRDGRIVQVGTPAEVFRKPVSEFVAHFVGSRNLYTVEHTDPVAGRVGLVGGQWLSVPQIPEFGKLLATVRPEDISLRPGSLAPELPEGQLNQVNGTLARVDDRGKLVRLSVEGRLPMTVTMTRQAFGECAVVEGGPVTASFDASAVHLLTGD